MCDIQLIKSSHSMTSFVSLLFLSSFTSPWTLILSCKCFFSSFFCFYWTISTVPSKPMDMAKGRSALYSGNHSYVTINQREISTLTRNSNKTIEKNSERKSTATVIATQQISKYEIFKWRHETHSHHTFTHSLKLLLVLKTNYVL